MKRIYRFSQMNEEFGVVIGALVISVLAGPSVYDWAREFWSKNVIGSKYKETGKIQIIRASVPAGIMSHRHISDKEIRQGYVETECKEYQDTLGNKYWGYDHYYTPHTNSDETQDLDIYTAMFKLEDFIALKSYLENINELRSGDKNMSSRPKPIDMIWRRED